MANNDITKAEPTSRADAIKMLFKGAGYFALGGFVWNGFVKASSAEELVLRPPGAITEKDFLKACIKCGLCVEACPYDTLRLSNPKDNKFNGTPYFVARETPCYMCTDIPCVPVCPTEALDENSLKTESDDSNMKLDVNKSKMGLAVINKDTCIAFWGIQCDACYRACPLIGEAIYIEYEKNERTGKHAFLKPVVNADFCTGCGLCEHACVTEVSAIKVLPLAIAKGKVGDHYIKGWDKKDELRLNEIEKQAENNNSKAIDYLNGSDDIFDD